MKDRLVYPGLRLGWRLMRFLRSRLTPTGNAVFAGLVASAAWGVDTNISMAYQAFTLLLAMLALSAAAGLLFRPRVRVRRVLGSYGSAGQPLPYSIEVRNLGARVLRGASVREQPRDPRPSFAEFHAAADPPDARFFWLDRVAGYARWRRLTYGREAACAEVPLPDLPPGATVSVPARLVPQARGRLELEGVSVAAADPVGLWRALRPQPLPESVLVLPKRYPVPGLKLPGARRYQPGGVALASTVGESQEFIGLRDYRPGDPLRSIHWKSFAKSGKPIVKQHRDEYFVRHALVLDTFGPAGAAFEEAVSVAASFACTALTRESLLDLLFVGAQAYRVTAGRGLGGAGRMLEVLATVAPCEGKSFDVLTSAVERRRRSLSGCILVLLDFDEPRRALLRRLRASGVPVLAAVVSEMGRRPPAEPADGRVHFLEAGRVAEGLLGLVS